MGTEVYAPSAYVKRVNQRRSGIVLHRIDAELSAEQMPFDCERIVHSRSAAHHEGE